MGFEDEGRAHEAFVAHFAPGKDGDVPMEEFAAVDTSTAGYVWLPLRFEAGRPLIERRDEWSPAEYEDD